MLHRAAEVQKGQTVLVHGASGGVGTLLSQLAGHAGARVIGTASAGKHEVLRAAGVEPVDYRTEDVPAAVRGLVPGGVDAVFDHIGGTSLVDSYNLLAPGGIVVGYGSLSTLHETGHWARPFVGILGRVTAWELRRRLGMGRGRRARFYSVSVNDTFATDLAEVFALAQRGVLDTGLAGRHPLANAADALRELAEGRVTGKLVLTP